MKTHRRCRPWCQLLLLTLLFLFSSGFPVYRVRRLMIISHLWRSRASSFSACIFVKSCSTQFIQVFLGLPLGLLPSTSIQNTLPSSSVLDLLATCPYHLNLLTLITLITSDNSHLRSNSSLLTLSAKLVQVIIRIILPSQLRIVISRFCVSGHVSEVYRNAERIHKSYTAALFLRGMLLFRNKPDNSLHFDQAMATPIFTVLSAPPSGPNMSPR